jgi:hypothetical protein
MKLSVTLRPRKRLSNEGHGFSRAINGFRLTALAAEVRFSKPKGQSRGLFAPKFAGPAGAVGSRLRCSPGPPSAVPVALS